MRRCITVLLFAVLVLSVAAASGLAQSVQNVELHGYIQSRLYVPSDSQTRFGIERVSLSAVGKLGDDGTAYVELYLHPGVSNEVSADSVSPGYPSGTSLGISAEDSRTYIESAYMDLPFAKGRIRIGKGRQLNFGLCPTYPNRKTTQYGILAETFTQDRIMGFQYNAKSGAFDYGASLFTDLVGGVRGIGGFPGAVGATQTVRHLVDKDIPGDISGRMAVSGKVGWTNPRWQVHFSGMTGGLNESQLGAVGGTNTDHSKYGVDAIYTTGPWVLQGEGYKGTWGNLDIDGYQFLAGFQPKGKTRVYARWSALNNSTTAVYRDVQQFTFGVVQPIREKVWVELNYEKNEESGASVGNDLTIVEFFSGF